MDAGKLVTLVRSALLSIWMATGALLFSGSSDAAGIWAPDVRMIAALEPQIRTPANAPEAIGPIDSYARFYIGVTIKGRRMIRGELVQVARECSEPKHDVGLLCEYRAGLHVNEDLPSILDGGCAIVNLLYDPTANRIVWLHCNGVA